MAPLPPTPTPLQGVCPHSFYYLRLSQLGKQLAVPAGLLLLRDVNHPRLLHPKSRTLLHCTIL